MGTPGCVYFYRFGTEDCFRIGRTKNEPEDRRRDVSAGSPRKLTLYREVKTDDTVFLEGHIHKLLDLRRTENADYFNVSADELDNVIAAAEASLAERSPLLQQVADLKERKPTDNMLEPSDVALSLYRELREAKQQQYLLKKKIDVLEAKLKVQIGENLGLRGVASWWWREQWRLDPEDVRQHANDVWERFKYQSCTRVFELEARELNDEIS